MKYNYNGKTVNINKELIISNLKYLDLHSIEFLDQCHLYCMKYYDRKWAKDALTKINKVFYGTNN